VIHPDISKTSSAAAIQNLDNLNSAIMQIHRLLPYMCDSILNGFALSFA
jgi:hypothetical protein